MLFAVPTRVIMIITSGMLSIVGDRESAHAKLEACTALWYVHYGLHIYIERENHPFTSLGGLAMLANKCKT